MNAIAVITLVLFTIIPTHAQTVNLTGKWIGTMTRTAPDGRTQTIDWMLDLEHNGDVVNGTAGPNAERQWKFEKGTIEDGTLTFKVQQPDGPMRTFTLTLVKGRLQGEMLAEFNGQSFTTTVDLGRAE